MVQRKVPSKLGIQADHVKSEKRLGNLKTSSCPHQDGKNRGPDMKKKMKRSRSIKLSDIEGLKSSPLRKTVSQPGKPPPLSAPTTTSTPQKQPMIKTSVGSPNYMKATSSSEARKERSQVSSLKSPTSSDSKNLRRRISSNSKLTSASIDKATRSLTRTSSLKLVRTLTKTPSFKPARNAAKKCSRVALCADMNVHKATCSSTLKDSNFPAYLTLNPGGTEAEGTSVMKVCPYTYCSLNGHHHNPLPPLKCFLKAKRRSMKAQKSAKLEVPSTCKAKPSVGGTEEISSELLIFSSGKHPQDESDPYESTNIAMVKEMGMDFFIEIYARTAADGAEATEKYTGDDEGTISLAGEHEEENNKSSIHGGKEVATEQDNRKQGAEKVDDVSSYLEISYASMEEDDDTSEASNMDWEEGQFFTSVIQTEADYLNKPEKEFSINVDYLSKIKQLDFPDEPKIITSDDMISNCTEEILVDEVGQELFEEETASFDTQSRDGDSEIEGMLHEVFEQETTKIDGDSTTDKHSFNEDALEEPTAIKENSEEAERDLTGAANASRSMGEPTEESAVAKENIQDNGVSKTELQLGDAENDCNTTITSEDLDGYQEDKSLQADEAIEVVQSPIAESSQRSNEESKVGKNGGQKFKGTEIDENLAMTASSLQELPAIEAGDPTEEPGQVANVESSNVIQISDVSHSSSEADQDDVEVSDSQNHITAEACQLDNIAGDSTSSQELATEIEQAKHCDCLLDGQHEGINVVENLFERDQDGANKFNIPTSTDSGEQCNFRVSKISSSENDTGEVEKMEVVVCTEPDTAETFLAANNGTSTQPGSRYLHKGKNSSQELESTCNRKWTIQCKKPIIDSEEWRNFNPREPNFLPVVPDPEAEKVDLKHQNMDDRKNSEEWMIDYALRQAVTKLAPARKRKVALLVEAFEAVLPVPKYETHIRNASAAFTHTRPMQACS